MLVHHKIVVKENIKIWLATELVLLYITTPLFINLPVLENLMKSIYLLYGQVRINLSCYKRKQKEIKKKKTKISGQNSSLFQGDIVNLTISIILVTF